MNLNLGKSQGAKGGVFLCLLHKGGKDLTPTIGHLLCNQASRGKIPLTLK